ncbi:polysaccharide deacetylase family protein [Polynucleobacter sp. UB-Raua-W9]|uniref:polysaccharide deacetylase family protein n=1 Tax=Polynucleobacter sp. UB-Raua-W9 TaxID=1819736 RepID=UPI001BFD01F5|nr:polysaccharide deacetylase family protein [Polynucleobacter sp. UB-Raua-W9]QWD72727.1 polysaccharide deacetylase family protein [Polynucleobacter sp. UB-Raua-W9]
MNKFSIVMYHYVRPIRGSRHPRIKGLELEGFKRQLDFLSEKYTLITAEQLISYASGSGDLPSNACYLTFDDGYKDHIEFVLPELLTRGIQGSFFAPVDAVENREMLDVNAIHFILSSSVDSSGLFSELNNACKDAGYTDSDLMDFKKKWAVKARYDGAEVAYLKSMLQHALPKEVRKEIISKLFKKYVGAHQADFADELYMSLSDVKGLVDSGMYVGSHGCKHLWLGKVDKSVQALEISNSLKFLEKIGSPTEDWIMCYPYGSYNVDTLDLLVANHCAVGLTTNVDFASLERSKFLELSRFDTNDFPQ